jgi:hypothetical protein
MRPKGGCPVRENGDSPFVDIGQPWGTAWAGVPTHNEAKGIDTMGNTNLQGPSKRIRIVLADWSS